DVVVTKRDDQARNARLGIDLHFDAIDVRGAFVAARGVLELEHLSDLKEPEIAPHRDLAPLRIADPRAHGRAEPVDVQAHARSRFGRGHRALAGHADDSLERFGAAAVEVGELDAELSALVALGLFPDDLDSRSAEAL